VTIGALPDDVLLNIFYLCQEDQLFLIRYWWPSRQEHPTWYTLVQICERWRNLVLALPIYLNLRLLCTDRTPVREMLHIWPPLPIQVSSNESGAVHGVIAALEQSNRVCEISVDIRSSQVERFAKVMQERFPALIHLQLTSHDYYMTTPPALPNMFLGGSAPRLQSLCLGGIPFPGLPKLLLSANDLVELRLWRIPNTGYISPKAIVTALSSLTSLEILDIDFASPLSHPDQRIRRPRPPPRAVLPSLTQLWFHGVSEYLEDLLALIGDVPRLQNVRAIFFNQLIWDIRQLPRFISQAEMLGSSGCAKLIFGKFAVEIRFYPQGGGLSRWLTLENQCQELDWQVSSIAQLCNQFSFLLSSVQELDILEYHDFPTERYSKPSVETLDPFNDRNPSTLQVDTSNVEQLDISYNHPFLPLQEVYMDNTQWLELFQPFITVHTLRISGYVQSLIVPAFEELTGEAATEVLPALNSIYLGMYEPSGPEHQAIELFVTARQHSGHPVAIHRLERPLQT
jgi:hypothetical protein